MKDRLVLAQLGLMAAPFALLAFAVPAPAQSLDPSQANLPGNSIAAGYTNSTYSFSWLGSDAPGSGEDRSADRELPLPEALEPAAAPGGNPERYNVPYAAEWRQPPFSRIGIGADVSPLGIGIKSAIVLNQVFDARLMGNFFNYNSGRFELEGFNVNANLHLASAAASLDWYPFNSIWRLSPGLMFLNGNQLSVATTIVPGTSFTLDNQTFYSAKANAATGATPLAATGVLGLHTIRPAFTIAGGFGKFIPRSNRHWSFPSEFGVAFTGGPSVNVNPSGWACLEAAQTECSNIGDAANPVAIKFNNALQSSLTKWRTDLDKVQVYPLFSYSVVYSFNIR